MADCSGRPSGSRVGGRAERQPACCRLDGSDPARCRRPARRGATDLAGLPRCHRYRHPPVVDERRHRRAVAQRALAGRRAGIAGPHPAALPVTLASAGCARRTHGQRGHGHAGRAVVQRHAVGCRALRRRRDARRLEGTRRGRCHASRGRACTRTRHGRTHRLGAECQRGQRSGRADATDAARARGRAAKGGRVDLECCRQPHRRVGQRRRNRRPRARLPRRRTARPPRARPLRPVSHDGRDRRISPWPSVAPPPSRSRTARSDSPTPSCAWPTPRSTSPAPTA